MQRTRESIDKITLDDLKPFVMEWKAKEANLKKYIVPDKMYYAVVGD